MSDFVLNAGFSVFAPVFAVFVTNQISDGSLRVIGFAAAITQITKVLFQIPVARILDKNHGEYDDFYAIIFGGTLMALTPFMYLVATQSVHVYIIQAIYGLGLAFLVPPWYAIFSRHLDKSHENIEWSLESVSIGIASAGAAAIGGILAQRYGFSLVFVIGGILALVGVVIQIRIYGDIRQKVPRGQIQPQPEKPAVAS